MRTYLHGSGWVMEYREKEANMLDGYTKKFDWYNALRSVLQLVVIAIGYILGMLSADWFEGIGLVAPVAEIAAAIAASFAVWFRQRYQHFGEPREVI